MRTFLNYFSAFVAIGLFAGCAQSEPRTVIKKTEVTNSIRHAKGISIYNYSEYTVIHVKNPWPQASKKYSYVLKKNTAKLPDSLLTYTAINVPVKSAIVTSTTHIPSLEMLNAEDKLIGFPGLDLISSEKVRLRIDTGKIRELGQNQSINTEVVIDLDPDVFIGHGIDNNNPTLDNLQKSGIKILLNGDWNEQSSLGKAEWIKLFGALFGKQAKADSIFSSIEKEYNATFAILKKARTKPTVLSGAMFENKWYLPQGNSWGAQLILEAGGNYLWKDANGTGSLSLPFESVLEKGKNALFWIGPGQFTSLKEMTNANPHYSQFNAFKSKNVYSFSSKKGKTGGILYFELAPNRPDILLKDIVKILHPELLPNHTLFFFEKLK